MADKNELLKINIICIITKYVKYDILGRLLFTTNLKVTVVRTRKKVKGSLASGDSILTVNVAKAKLLIAN